MNKKYIRIATNEIYGAYKSTPHRFQIRLHSQIIILFQTNN